LRLVIAQHDLLGELRQIVRYYHEHEGCCGTQQAMSTLLRRAAAVIEKETEDEETVPTGI